jgi:hypothetical protein
VPVILVLLAVVFLAEWRTSTTAMAPLRQHLPST